MSSITVAARNLGEIQEGSLIPVSSIASAATFDNVWEVISQAYPTADRTRTVFTFEYGSPGGTSSSADFVSDDLTFSQALVFLNGSVRYSAIRTVDDTVLEGNESILFQLVLRSDRFALDIRDGDGSRVEGLNPSRIQALFAPTGLTFNLGKL